MSLTKTKIESLLALCKDGNRLAQLEVYNRYENAMYNTALRIVKDTAQAEDVMQESFITAFSKLDSFKGTATFGAWLKRIVINNSIAQYKKSQRFVAMEDEHLNDGVDENLERSNEDYSSLRFEQVKLAMGQLNDGYRNILSLHFIEGYDYEEICEVMEISYANCRTLVSRAKDSLRKKIALL